MTIMVTGIVAVPLSLTAVQLYESALLASDKTTAGLLAQNDLETVKNTAYDSVSSTTVADYAGSGLTLTRTVTWAQGSALTAESLKQVRVTLTRPGASNPLADQYTYLVRNVLYGS